jgi:Fe-S cluster biogenesis protein NfuA
VSQAGFFCVTYVTVEPAGRDEIEKLCREILAPLVAADGGEMYLVGVSADEIRIHLAGTCSGCPGVSLTRDRIFAPVLLGAMPKARLTVTTGWHVPPGALRIVPPEPVRMFEQATEAPTLPGTPG